MSNIERTGLNQSGLPNEYANEFISVINRSEKSKDDIPQADKESPSVQKRPVNHEQHNSANRITAKGLLKPFLTGFLITGLAVGEFAFTIHQDKLVNEELKDSNNFKNTTEAVQDQERANAIENAEDDFNNYHIELPQ